MNRNSPNQLKYFPDASHVPLKRPAPKCLPKPKGTVKRLQVTVKLGSRTKAERDEKYETKEEKYAKKGKGPKEPPRRPPWQTCRGRARGNKNDRPCGPGAHTTTMLPARDTNLRYPGLKADPECIPA